MVILKKMEQREKELRNDRNRAKCMKTYSNLISQRRAKCNNNNNNNWIIKDDKVGPLCKKVLNVIKKLY